MIKIVAPGKIKENYLKEGISDYLKRISKYTKIEVIEIKEENKKEDKANLYLEAQDIIKELGEKDYVIVLDINGKNLSSIELAMKIDDIYNTYSNITFVIGSSSGLDPLVKERANLLLSFGKNTYPHQVFRFLLLEQIYRAYKINNNERYHKWIVSGKNF